MTIFETQTVTADAEGMARARFTLSPRQGCHHGDLVARHLGGRDLAFAAGEVIASFLHYHALDRNNQGSGVVFGDAYLDQPYPDWMFEAIEKKKQMCRGQ